MVVRAFASQSGTGSDYRCADVHHFVTDSATGMDLLGARYYVAALGRFLTQDPIGQEGGLNLYAYCDNNPLGKVDPKGTDGTDVFRGWGNALHAFGGWLLSIGPTDNVYQPGSIQSEQMRESAMGEAIYLTLVGHKFLASGINLHGYMKGDSSFDYHFDKAGSVIPFIATLDQPWNGTQAQVGGFKWTAVRSRDQIEVHVHNVMSMTSFCYQLGVPSWDRFGSGYGPMGNVNQDFYWNVKVPAGY